jgi:Peptidase M61 N-terminal domain
MKAKFYILIYLLYAVPAYSQNSKITPEYTITFKKGNFKEAFIDATLPLPADSLYMSVGMVEDLPEGWAHFVKDLKATTLDGSALNIKAIGKSQWSIENAKAIKLSYRVELLHDTYQWKTSGSFARGYVQDSLAFFAGRVLLIIPRGVSKETFAVNFNLPQGYSVSTPYTEVGSGTNKFSVYSASNLWANCNMVGYLVKDKITVNELTVEIAVPLKLKGSIKLLSNTFKNLISSYDSLMGGSPKGLIAIMVVKLLITASVSDCRAHLLFLIKKCGDILSRMKFSTFGMGKDLYQPIKQRLSGLLKDLQSTFRC